MASLKEIRSALKTTIEANIANVRVFHRMPDVTEGHSILVEPEAVDYSKTFGRGFDEYDFNLYVMVPNIESSKAQDLLDEYVAGAGTKSIRQVIFNNRTLGLTGTDAFIKKMHGYGGHFEVARIQHIGAVLDLCVLTSGTA